MLRVNEILKHDGVLYRVLQIAADQIVWIDMKANSALPTIIFLEELTNAIDNGLLSRESDPYDFLAVTAIKQGSTAQIKRDQNFGCIREMVNNSACFDPSFRSKKIEEICSSTGITKVTIYKLLRRYWQRGQTPNSLLPDYKNSGAKGKKRIASTNKLGRPRKHTPGVGAIVDETVERLFRIAIERHVLTTKEKSFPYAHRRFIDIYKAYFPATPECEMPSLGQMRYFFNREYGKENTLMKRIKPITYNKDISPLTSTVNANALGPASRIEIDATIAEFIWCQTEIHTKL